MPIIIANQIKSCKWIRICVPLDLLEEVRQYCEAFSISEPRDFFGEAAKHVLTVDEDWKKIRNKANPPYRLVNGKFRSICSDSSKT